MKSLLVLPLAGLVFFNAAMSWGQTVSWSGAADGVSWTNAGNWVGGFVPGPPNDVVINSGAGAGVTISTGTIVVRSLQCAKGFSLTGGSLTLTWGTSLVSGAFSVANGAVLTVTGAGSSLTVSGPTGDVSGDLSAKWGAAIHMTSWYSVTNTTSSATWYSEGSGSLLDFSSLTNVTLANNRILYLTALKGGQIDLHRLATSTGSVRIDARDAASVVDLSGLAGRWKSVGNYSLGLEARAGASILIPNVIEMENAYLAIDNTGAIPTAQLSLLTNVTLTVNGAAPNFMRLTNIDDCEVYALNGGVARLTNVFRATHLNQSPTWQADGLGSLVDLSHLTSVTLANNRILYLNALNGGQIDLHRLATSTGSVRIDARDVGSVVDLSGLVGRWKSVGNYPLGLEAQTGASVLIPNVIEMENAYLTIDNTGAIPTAQLSLLTNVTLTVNGAAPNFMRLTNIDGCDLYARNGGVARLTNVFRATHLNQSPTWQADGIGSLVDLSHLTGVTLANNRILYLNALNGGQIDLHRLATSTGSVRIDARDVGSVVDLSGLAGRWKSVGNYSLELEARAGASILIPNVIEMENAYLTIDDTGAIPTAQLSLLTNVTLTVNGAAPNFMRLTNIDDCDVYARNGGVARLTNVFRATHLNQSPTWQADGTGSLVDLSSLTNVTLANNRILYLNALNGGQIDLHRLATSTGSVRIDARDAASLVDLSGLVGRWKSMGNYSLGLEARAGAVILIPNVTEMENAYLTIDNTGAIPTAQLSLLTNVTLTVNGAAPNFMSLTNIDDCDVYALNGGVARLTNVFRATHLNRSPTWQADGIGSLIDLSGLSEVSVGPNRILYVEGYQGGKIDMRQLPSLSTGAVRVLADGTGTVVDLSTLSCFISVGSYPSSATAQNGGVILLNDQAFLLANVDIDIPPGNPVLPATVTASPTVTIYGSPSHIYVIEQRDTTNPNSPWVFVAKVELVGDSQVFASAAPPDTEFRIQEFLGDAPVVELSLTADHQVQMVLYGAPLNSYEILASPTLDPGATWQPTGVTVTLTNTFQILAPTAALEPVRFFRARKL